MGSASELRGQARRTRQSLTARHGEITAELRWHVKICGECTRARNDVFRRCDEGWLLTKLELRARRAIERYDGNHPDNQDTLFGG